jgi:anaerobic magnesium-protoporphyrin IX monomethyl ester cyclase
MMDILLAHAYFLGDDPLERRIMKPYPPLGILYCSSYLKSRGFGVGIFDSTFSSMQEFKNLLNGTRPPVVGLSVNMMTKTRALEMIRASKDAGCTVVVGGPEVTEHAENFLRFGADVALFGEGEITLEELLPQIRQHGTQSLHGVRGVAFLDGDGQCVRNAPRPLIPDLNALPIPDRESIPMERYLEVWREHHGRGSVSLICARGCPFTCTWCSRSVFGDSHRRRSVENVADEIAVIRDRYNPDMLWFADDVFTIHHGWIRSFQAELRRRNIRIPFECISRADRLNEEILAIMSDLGAFRIWYGAESGSQRILDAMDRRVTVDQIRSATRIARKHGIQSGLFVMLGYPGEEIPDIDATIAHLKETQPDTYLTTVAYPIKGTTLYNAVADRLLAAPWAETTDRALNFHGRHSDRFYWFATRHLVNEVRKDAQRRRGGWDALRSLLPAAKSRIARAGMLLSAGGRT